ncbi:MAG TPA: AarF/UbiB family protein [Caldilineaceae bacterium]|nr:AarF/UbiB family protein [Caldilineaceae bacterium]
MSAPQEHPNGGFEILQERPPQSLLRRFFVTQSHLFGLLFGGGAAYVRDRRAQGQGGSFSVLFIRFLLLFAWPFLDKRIVRQPFPVQFRMRLELLGPTYIKLGQILSLRQDLLPSAITDELQSLLDRLPVVSFARFQELVEEDLQIPLGKAFAWIEPTPLGSASLAQTHRARLFSGEDVVLKVIKPGVRETIQQDIILLQLLGRIMQFFLARYQPQRIINEFCSYTLREVDLRFEADNAETFAANFKDTPNVTFPRIYRQYSGRSVLCMEFFQGIKRNGAIGSQLSARERSQILDLGISSVVQMLFHDGFFHADPHPGNLIIFPDLRIGFIDLGMVGRIDEATRKNMLYYFYALVMGDPEHAARVLTNIAVASSKSDLAGLRRELTDLNRRWVSGSKFHRFSAAQLILQSINLAGRYYVYYPEEIILMTKTLVTIEGVGSLLEPNLELASAARSHVQKIILSEFNPLDLWQDSLLSAPEFLDVLRRSPMILANVLQQMEGRNQMPAGPSYPGIKQTILAGFCLVAVALLVTAGAHWLVWLSFAVLTLVLALNGLRE